MAKTTSTPRRGFIRFTAIDLCNRHKPIWINANQIAHFVADRQVGTRLFTRRVDESYHVLETPRVVANRLAADG